jgi:demethylmenaquinone methyltransferase/2-methoxy-6-polyprenyl-1,4-benzoquinol methylase
MTMAGGSHGNQVAREVFAGLPPRYDRLAWLLSFGQDRRWRRAVVDRVAARQPGRVLDVATGPAGVALEVARRTGSTVAGIDLNEPMLRARQRPRGGPDGTGGARRRTGRTAALR